MKDRIKYYSKPVYMLAFLCSTFIASGQLVANFSASTISGCAPLLVQFTDNSTGNPAEWSWDLGNGAVSTQKNPVTTYANAGIYSIKLTVTNSAGSNSITKTQYITIFEKPVVRFTVSDSSDCVPFTTTFTDLSTTTVGSITAWHWDFDDGTNSALQNPQHSYTVPGNNNITLKVTNSGGCTNTLSKLAYIKAADDLRPQFSFTKPSKCKPPEVIAFSNNTLGPGTLSFTWYFGDGTTSGTFSPSHTYASGGTYSVKLVARSTLGCIDSVTYIDTFTIKNVQSIISAADSVCVDYKMPLLNSTSPAPLSTKWVFSDGTSSFGTTTLKSWQSPGNYTIKLVSNFSACSDSVLKNVTVLATPVVNFSASDSASCKAPFAVNFTDLTGTATNWLWNFGDGNTSVLQNPSHTFMNEGEYDIKLTANSGAGCSASNTQYRFIRILKPNVTIDLKEGGGCKPYTFRPSPITGSVDGVVSWLWDFGNGNTSTDRFPVAVYSDSGTYDIKLTIASADGCIDSAIAPAGVRVGNHPIVDFGLSPTVVCPGVNVQFTNFSVPSDRWQWYFSNRDTSSAQNPLHKFSDSGKYSIKLIAWNNGCSDSVTKSKVLTVLPGLARFRPVFNCTNKKEVYFKDSSILPQTWQWDFGDGGTSTIQNPTHVFANYQPYTVSLTTTNGVCTNTRTIIVTPKNEIPDFIATGYKLCSPDATTFYMQNFNKANVVKYTWDFGDGTTDNLSGDSVLHTYLNGGNYTVSLTAIDTNGCSETTVKTNLIHVHEPRAGFAVNAAGGCRNKSIVFTDTSNYTNNNFNIAEWFWDFGDGQSQTFIVPPPNPVTHVYADAGHYFPSLKITDSLGCSDSVSYAKDLSIYQPAAVFFSPNFNTCINDTVIFRNPSTGNHLTYLWSFGDGTFSTDSLPIKKYSSNGDFTMKLVITDAAGCKDSTERNNYIKVRDVTASFTISDSVGTCTPFEVDFTNTSTNALSQVWDFGDGGFSTNANPVYYYATPGNFYAKLTTKRSNHCLASDSVKITVTGPIATLNYSIANGCSPVNVAFNVASSDTLSYIWDFNDGASYSSSDSVATHNYTDPGNFVPSVVIKDNGGCVVSITGKDTIKVYSTKVDFTAIDTTVCSGDSIYFSDASFSGSTITNYRWDFGDGSFSAIKNPTHFYTTGGAYTIKLFVTTVSGCTDSLTKPGYIKIFSTPQVSISGSNATYCGPSSITFAGNTPTVDTLSANWHWNFGNGQTAAVQNPSVQQYKDTGSYTIQLILSYSGGCADTANTSLRILPIPNTFAGKDTAICAGTSATLTAAGADNYTWQPASFLTCTNCIATVSNTPDDIMYSVKGTNRFGCEKTDSIFIDVKKPFRLNMPVAASALCQGKNIQLTVSGAENYIWSPAAGLSNANIANPLASPSVSTTYKVIGYDSINCFKDSASVAIQVYPAPTVNAGADIILSSGRDITLSPQYSGDIINWLWQPSAGLSCTDCANPVATPASGITYTIEVTNADGCKAVDNIFVQLRCDKNNIYVPTAFSPNNGSLNNIFYPLTPVSGASVTITAFKIYNRTGELVFENANFPSGDITKGWDGKYKGTDAPTGAYVYTIEFVCANKQLVAFNGNILLLR